MNKLVAFIFSLLMVLYPVGVYFGLQHFDPKWLAIGLCALLIFRALLVPSGDSSFKKLAISASLIAGLSLSLLSYLQNTDLGLKLYPVVISLSFLAIFVYSILSPPTVIERIARLQEPDLPQSGVIYTRKVTIIWCLFFVFNAVVASYTVFYASTELWTLYNGFLSYLLMGSLMAGEFIYRKYLLKP